MEGKKNEDGAKNPINLEPQFDRGVNYFQMVKKKQWGVYVEVRAVKILWLQKGSRS